MKRSILKRNIKRLPHLIAIVLTGAAALSACQSAEKKIIQHNQAPEIVSADLFPPLPRQGEAIVVKANSTDEEKDAVTYRYQWFVNDQSVHDTLELPAAFFKRGDKIAVEITPNDGFNDGPVFKTASVLVQNTPPEILSIQLLPQPFLPGENIRAIVTGKDRDDDHIEYTYEWQKNGEPIFLENQAEVKIQNLKKGDQVTVRVTPHDGREAGKSVESLNLASGNRPPEITSHPSLQFKNGVYLYPVTASDPDGDPLKYSIEDPQPGMHFDPMTGVFQWEIPETTTGVQHLTLVVRDPEGEGAAQRIRLDIDFLRHRSVIQ